KGMMWRSLKADAWPGIDEGLARLDVDSLRAMHRLVEYCMLPLPRFDEELKEKLGGLDRKSLDRVASSSRKIINYLVVNDFEVLSQDERLLDNDGLNEALKSLSHYNKSNSTEDRRRAASMLERHYALWTINIGLEQRQKGVRNMVAALSDPDYLVRKKMAAAVGYLKSPQAVDALNNLLDDPSAAVRKNAALALENIGESRSIDTLRQRLEHEEDREVVDYLRVAIESLKKKSN
ncbi:MAG: HEAT repeat domain-containing protein, partial [Candidatus Altiarchaeota archaeon]|nr:HEAT repeat domain-containing protein [Candidatus Altiarchaeota archaeon]